MTTILQLVVIACMLTVTAVVVRREFFPPIDARQPASPLGRVVPNAEWETYREYGREMSKGNGTVTIVEFADFQCPVCRDFSLRTLKGVRASFPEQAIVLFRHWPLNSHPHAYRAAVASECAAAQGRFEPMHDLMFLQQDSIGVRAFDSFAAEAGVGDIPAFVECMDTNDRMPVIDRDVEAITSLAGTGTPTIIFNGRRISGAPDSTRFHRMIAELIDSLEAGK
jgi:protein-disulfide isomerase